MRIDRKKAVSIIKERFDRKDGSMMLAARCMAAIPTESDDFASDLRITISANAGEDEAAKLRRHYKKRSGGRSRTRDAMLAFKDEMFAILMESEVK